MLLQFGMKEFCVRRFLRTLVSPLLVVLALCALVAAQSTTNGSIGGTIYDPNGAVVSGAAVTLHNNGNNSEKNITTDSSGFYRVNNLQPGSYTVSVNAQGFGAYKAENVIVEVGRMTEISPRLSVGGAAEQVQVSAEAPLINTTSPDFAPALNEKAIQNLPINGGRWSSFAVLTPGVVNDSNGFGLLSFRGISTLLNNNTIDGADNNQAFFSEERGRTRAGYSTAKVAVDEFQVNTSNYSAEYGRSAGGVVNTVTKSGTNEIHGNAYFFDRDYAWASMNPFTTITKQTAPGVYTSLPYKPTDIRKMTGIGIGGPIIKDKLFWYFAFDYFTRNFPGTAVASAPAAFFATPTTATIATLAGRLGVTPAQAQLDYNNGLNGLLSMLGTVPRTGTQNIFFPKIDWNINDKNHASFVFNRMRWWSPAGIQTQATNNYGIASFGNDYVKDTWGVAKLDTFFTSNLSNQARYQYGRDFEFENNQTPTPYEQNTLVNPPGYTNPLGLPPAVFITNGFNFGVPSFLERPAYPDERRQQFADTVSWTHGNHSLKFGGDFNHVNDNSQNLRYQYGGYSYSSLLNYFSDLYAPDTCKSKTGAAVPCYSNFQQAFGPLGFTFNTNDWAFFAEDDWRVKPRLTVSLGLRWEYEQIPSPILANPLAPQTSNMPNDKNNWGPRAGFAWDIFGDGRTSLRGGIGMYYGRIINSTIYSALTSTGEAGSQLSYFFTPSTTSPNFPQILPTTPTGTVKPSIVYFNNGFQNPQITETDLSFQRDLGWNTVLSLNYLGSFGHELPGFLDTNLASTANITYTVVDPSHSGPLAAGAKYTVPLYNLRPNTSFGSMTDIFSGINSNYNAFAVMLNHRYSNNIQFSFNYTWSHALDDGQNEATFTDTNDFLYPNCIRCEYGDSQFDVRQRFTFQIVASEPWHVNGWAGYLANGWQLSPMFQVQDGLPYSMVTSGTPLGGASTSFNGTGGASGRVPFLDRNSFNLPGTVVFDLRASKSLQIRERYSFEFSADAFNLMNHVNYTGVNNTAYIIGTNAVGAPTLTYNTTSAGVPVFGTFNSANSNYAYSTRQIQLGVQLKF